MTSTPSPAPRSFVRPFSNTTKEGKNMNKIALPTLLITAAISLAACSTGGTPTTKAPANPQAFFETNGVKTQVKTVAVGTTSTSIKFEGGTELTFAPGALLDASGNPYTGDVKVSVREIRSRSDMILSNVLPVSDMKPLVSGGMFNLELQTPAGADLKINPAKGVQAVVPAVGPIDKQMGQFVGNKCLVTPRPATGQDVCAPLPEGESSVNWAPVAGQFGINTNTTPGSYVFSVFNKGWINCDFFYSDPRPKGTIFVEFTPLNDLNTIVFLIPKNITTVIALYTRDGANRRKSYANSLPIGLEGEIVALTFNGGKQYLAHKSVTIADQMTVNLAFAEASDNDIKSYLAATQ